MSKRILLGCLSGLLALNLFSVEVGIIGGRVTNPSEFNYGISGGSGLFVPLLKTEIEFYPLTESVENVLCASLKIRPKFGKFAPFAAVGADQGACLPPCRSEGDELPHISGCR